MLKKENLAIILIIKIFFNILSKAYCKWTAKDSCAAHLLGYFLNKYMQRLSFRTVKWEHVMAGLKIYLWYCKCEETEMLGFRAIRKRALQYII